jgi:3-methyladenine DNA glycosylase/8-oxoguanine DNA glycosylase
MSVTKAERHLRQADPILAEVVLRIGRYSRHYEPDAWRALSSSSSGQQVSTHAARAIRGRFAACFPARFSPHPPMS